MVKRLRGINFIIIVLLALGLAGCAGDDTTTSTDTGDTISNESSIAFTGKVVDPLGNPLSGVSIELISDTKQADTTDANGNWLINVDLGEIKATPGGGSDGGDAGEDLQDNPDQLVRNYPIEFSKTGFPTYRYEVAFHATIGYTDGTGAVVLLSKTGNVQPTTILHPYVDNFEFKVYAGADPAPGAVVTLWAVGDAAGDLGENLGSVSGSRYEIDTKMFQADSEGIIKVTKDALLPANANYAVFAAPYDPDEDGVYEYDSSVATQPAGGFNLNVANVAGALIHYELDADGNSVITQTEFAPSVLLTDRLSDIRVTYLNIQNVNIIPVEQADDFEIVVMFNRPVIEQELAAIGGGPLFTLTGRGGVTIPFSQVNTGNYLYTLTPDSTLTPANNQYIFTIANLVGSSGGFGVIGLVQNFNIYDPDAAMYAAIPPGLDIEANRSFKVDWNDVLLGDPSVTNPYAKAGMIPNVRISWPAYDADADGVEDATGYEAWVKDSDTPWQNVTANMLIDYNDGQYYEAVIDLTLGGAAWGGLFDSFDADNDSFGLGFTEPFFAQTLQIVIMPQNANGFAMDPNTDATIAGLSLKDNWGPEVVAGLGWDGVLANATDFTAATLYDDTVQITFDEPLKDAILKADYAAGEYGATVSSGYFKVGNNDPDVDPVRWSDLDLIDPETGVPYPSNRAFILVDLQPTVTTILTAAAVAGDTEVSVTPADMGNFAIGDWLNIDDTNEGSIVGFDVAGTFTLNAGLFNDYDSGDAVYWRGPIQAGYDDVNGALNAATNVNDLLLYVESTDNMGINQTVLTTPASGLVTAVNLALDRLTVTTAPDSHLASESTVSGYSVRTAAGDLVGADTADADTIAVTTMTALAAADQPVIVVADATDIAVGEILILDFGGANQQQVTVQTVVTTVAPAATVIFTANLTTALPAGTTVDERVDFDFTTLAVGYPLINLPAGGLNGIKPNSNITFSNDDESDTATVIGVFGNAVVINDILEDSAGARYTFAAGDDYTVDSARVPGALQINVLDRAGIATSATDTDGDGTADRDQIGYENVGGPFGIF